MRDFSYDIINEYDRRVHTIRHAPTLYMLSHIRRHRLLSKMVPGAAIDGETSQPAPSLLGDPSRALP